MTSNTKSHFPTLIIKIDIDYKLKRAQKKWIEKEAAKLQPIQIIWKKTKRGIHIKLILTKPVSFWRSIEIRSHLHDDPQRIVYDILRYRAGAKMIDVLFDKKTHIKEIIQVPS